MARRGSSPNKSNQIYYTVRDEIITGKYPGGTFIIENDLCEQFSVSRTPVREALIRLAQDQFVELIPNRGAVVPHLAITDIVDILQVRMVNEGLAAALLAQKHTDAILAKLEAPILREEQLLAADAKDSLEISREDFLFHNLLAANCGNARLRKILELIDNQSHRFSRISADSRAIDGTLTLSVHYHRQALDAIRRGDSEDARRIMEAHWQAMLNGYVQRSLDGALSLRL